MTDYTAHHRPDDARKLYIRLRSVSIAEQLSGLVRDRDTIEQTLVSLQGALQTATGTEIAQLNFKELERQQRRYGKIVGAISRLEELIRENEATRSLDELHAEFDQILAMPQVAAIKSDLHSLRIVVCGQVAYKDHLYDTGDWEISLPNGVDGFDSRVLRRTYVRREWPLDSYPSYYYHGGFCFGSNLQALEEYAQAGQILAAVQLAVHCICSVNPADQHRIPMALRRINRQEVKR